MKKQRNEITLEDTLITLEEVLENDICMWWFNLNNGLQHTQYYADRVVKGYKCYYNMTGEEYIPIKYREYEE